MYTQLSFLTDPEVKPRIYIRDRSGRFATKEQIEIEEAKRSARFYKRLYETEKRKLDPILKRMIRAERELYNMKNKAI